VCVSIMYVCMYIISFPLFVLSKHLTDFHQIYYGYFAVEDSEQH
jgi:hypothetical protein